MTKLFGSILNYYGMLVNVQPQYHN